VRRPEPTVCRRSPATDPATRLLSLFYRSPPAPAAPIPARIGRAAIIPTATVGSRARSYPAARFEVSTAAANRRKIRPMDDDQPLPELPDDWEAQDSLGCFYEYVELCRQERLAGKRDLPLLFQPLRPQE
jgi:hypothetical protein